MTDTMNDRYLHPQNEIIIFLFRNYYSIFPAPSMTDQYISIIFIPASFKYLSSGFLVSFKIFSSLHHYSILLTILPNCAGPILPPAPLQQCRRLNFYEEKKSGLN